MSDPDVHVGRDGWLFLIGGANKVAAQYARNSAVLPDRKLRQWAKLIENRARRLENMRIQYVHVSVPEKLTVYDNKLNEPPIVDWRLSPAVRLREMMQHSPYAGVWLDLVEPLRAVRDRDSLYFKTDTHWAAPGCLVAYRLICERIAIACEPDLLSRHHQDHGAAMDLGMKLNPPVGEIFTGYDFTKNSIRIYANPIARCLESLTHKVSMHVGAHVAFKNDAASAAGKKILVFGDSFALHGMTSLTGMLAETAREVEFIWSSNLDWSYIRRSRPDVVIYELAERFLTILPNDGFSLRWTVARRTWRAMWLMRKARNSMQAQGPA
jgi:alginate O-acetyltransferase complex protein AlgJ